MTKTDLSKDDFQVACPFCANESIWSLNLRWQTQSDLVCPNCEQNISKVILMAALNMQKGRLQKSLAITILIVIALITGCLLLVNRFANNLHQMPFFAVLAFCVAAIACSISVAVIIVLTKQLIFLIKRQRLIK